jgi:nucleoside-diphosphate-sugar epimerase
MRHALIFGATGQIGWPLADRLQDAGWRVTAVSRQPQRDQPGLHWIEGTLPSSTEPMPDDVDAIFSCGPLDLFAQWYAQRTSIARAWSRSVDSIDVKRGSSDKAERDVRARLRSAEQQVFDRAAACNAQATVLRPTLVYGAGATRRSRASRNSRSAGPLRAAAQREGCANPCTSHDLADAAPRRVRAPATDGKSYALPGGERLRIATWCERVLAVLEPPPTLVEVPGPCSASPCSARARWDGRRFQRRGGRAHAQRPGVRCARRHAGLRVCAARLPADGADVHAALSARTDDCAHAHRHSRCLPAALRRLARDAQPAASQRARPPRKSKR